MAADPASPSDPFSATLSPPPAPDGFARRPAWGPWASVGWTSLAELLIVATQLFTALSFAIARKLVNRQADLTDLGTNGPFLAAASLASIPVVLGLLVVLVHARGWRVGDYLALRPASGRAVLLALAGLILWLAAAGGVTVYLNRPIVAPIPVEAIFTTPLWFLSLAVVVASPLLEEVLFRGFLYRGFADSRLGPGLAIGLTAIAWTALHIQDNLFALATVYLTGLYLGAVRHYSGSLILTILLHGLANTVATAEVVIFGG